MTKTKVFVIRVPYILHGYQLALATAGRRILDRIMTLNHVRGKVSWDSNCSTSRVTYVCKFSSDEKLVDIEDFELAFNSLLELEGELPDVHLLYRNIAAGLDRYLAALDTRAPILNKPWVDEWYEPSQFDTRRLTYTPTYFPRDTTLVITIPDNENQASSSKII